MHRPLSNRADQPENERLPERARRYLQASSQSDIEIRDLHLPAGQSLHLNIRSGGDVTISNIWVGGRKS